MPRPLDKRTAARTRDSRADGNSATVRRLLLVVGIGRSGTSLLSGILGRLGFRIPQPEISPDETNPRGFGEPRWVVEFHWDLMRKARVTVFDSRPGAWETMARTASGQKAFGELRTWIERQFAQGDNLVVKDPRIDWFLPLWRRCAAEVGAEISFATMLRHPAEVVSSARKSYGEWQNDASRTAAWLNHTLYIERATRGAKRVFIRYDRLVDDWSRELSRLGEALDHRWLMGARSPAVDDLVDPRLRRSTPDWSDICVPAVLRVLAEDVWDHASRLAGPEAEDEAVLAVLDAAGDAYRELYAEAEAIAQSSVTAALNLHRRRRQRRMARYGRRLLRGMARVRRRVARLIAG